MYWLYLGPKFFIRIFNTYISTENTYYTKVRLEECKFCNINTPIVNHKQFHLSTGYVIDKLKQKCHQRTKANTYLLRVNNGHPRLFKAYHFLLSEDGRLEGYIFKARTPGGARARTEAGN